MSRLFPAIILFLLTFPLVNSFHDEVERIPEVEVRERILPENGKQFGMDGLFIENLGQLEDENILFYYQGDVNVFIFNDGIRVDRYTGKEKISYSLRLDGGEACKDIKFGTEGPRLNFYLGNDPSRWIRGGRTFDEITLEEIITGVDMRLHISEEGPKWDLILERGSLIDKVRAIYTGDFEKARIVKDHIRFEKGELSLVEGPFILLQNGNEVESELVLHNNRLSFIANSIDRDDRLIIDPLMASSTFVGGHWWDIYPEVKVHPSGNIVLAGTVESRMLETTANGYDRSHNGDNDVFVCMLSENLSSMRYGTYIGGTGNDTLKDICVDDKGNIFLAGKTGSSDFPVSSDAFLESYKGAGDGFIFKISPDLSRMNFSTYIGGSGNDVLSGISLSSEGFPCFCGSTKSDDLPVSPDCFQEDLNGMGDVFAGKLSINGSEIGYLTYLGGGGFGSDEAYDIQVDSRGRCIVAGYSQSDDFPTTEGVFKNGSGGNMGFISRFSEDGNELNMSTFLALGTRIFSFVLDEDENIVMTGRTDVASDKFPVTFNAYDGDLAGNVDGFVTKMDPDGGVILTSTYLGMNEMYGQSPGVDFAEEWCNDIVIDNDGCIIVTGQTESYNFPMSLDALDTRRDLVEAFLVKFDRNLSDVYYSTFIGGYEEDRGYGVDVDDDGWIYVSGDTYCDRLVHDFPAIEGAYQENHSSQYDWFCTRFKMDLYPPGPPDNLSSHPTNNSINLTWEPPLFDGNLPVLDYYVFWGNNEKSEIFLDKTENLWYNHTNLTERKTFFFTVRANNSLPGLGHPAKISDMIVDVPKPPLIDRLIWGDSHINVTWYPPWDPGAPGKIFYELHWGEDPLLLDNRVNGISNEWYNVTGLTNGVTYHFQVFARNKVGLSNGSSIKNATPYCSPSVPRNFTISSTDRTIFLNWGIPEETGGKAVFYTVYRYYDENYTLPVAVDIEETSLTFYPAINGQEYTFYVIARNPFGSSDPTRMLSIVPIGPISEPMNLRGEEHGTWVHLFWERPFKTGSIGNITYTIFMGFDELDLDPVSERIEAETCSIRDLTPGKVYYFAVMAFNSDFNSTLSNIISLRPMEVPTMVRNLDFITGDSYVNLSWNEPDYFGGDSEVTYSVHWGNEESDLVNVIDEDVLYHNVTGLTNGKTYYFSVRAMNSKGYGPFSRVLNITPLKVPSPPQFFEYTDGDGFLNLSWEKPLDFGGTRYVTYTLFISESEDELLVLEEDLFSKKYIIDGLVNGQVYFIAVAAVNEIGMSPLAGPLMAIPMTFPGPPVITDITDRSTGLLIEWDPPLKTGGSDIWFYHIDRVDQDGEKKKFIVVGNLDNYLDEDVERGNVYNYTVLAETSYGKGIPSDTVSMEYPLQEEEEGFPYWIFVPVSIAIFLIIAGASLGLITLRKNKESKE